MTTSGSEQVALAPGHRYLLDLLQRKLLQNIELYARLNSDRESTQGNRSRIEAELFRLRGKIKRISARQRRYTLEIINGNSTNTIPKESFFQALGLVTREALTKLNSKTSERRRRTTANPRFSHEAVQARRLAIEPLQQKRSNGESASARREAREAINSKRETKELVPTRREAKSRRTRKNHNSNNNNNNVNKSVNSNKNNDNNNNSKVNNIKETQPPNEIVSADELKKLIDARLRLIESKKATNMKLQQENENIKKLSLGILDALKLIIPSLTTVPESRDEHIPNGSLQQAINHDLWIDMKCDESLDTK